MELNNLNDFYDALKNLNIPLKFPKETNDVLFECDSFFKVLPQSSNLINRVIEDEILTKSELNELSDYFKNLDSFIQNIEKSNQNHQLISHQFYKLRNLFQKLTVPIQYIHDIERRAFPDGYDSIKKKGYYVDEDIYHEIIEFFFSELILGEEIWENHTKLEELLIKLSRRFAYANDKLLFNVLYVKKPYEIQQIEELINNVNIEINKYLTLIKKNYFRDDLEEANKGLIELMNNEKLEKEEKTKIKGRFTKIKGITEVTDFAYKFRGF